jgi:hypothetical protein
MSEVTIIIGQIVDGNILPWYLYRVYYYSKQSTEKDIMYQVLIQYMHTV